jgi:hypothetical protein
MHINNNISVFSWPGEILTQKLKKVRLLIVILINKNSKSYSKHQRTFFLEENIYTTVTENMNNVVLSTISKEH